MKCYRDLLDNEINWPGVAERLIFLRKQKEWNIDDVADQLEISSMTYSHYEQPGNFPKARRSVNILLNIIKLFDVNIKWIVTGDGKPNDKNTDEWMPPTIVVEKGAGIKQSDFRKDAEEGYYADEAMEFVLAVDNYKRTNKVMFPSLTQIYEIVIALGYRKTERPTIFVPNLKKGKKERIAQMLE